MRPEFAEYLTRPVPRYTSYPTVPHFQEGLGAQTYAGWLGALDPAVPLSLYLHVPFCSKVCWYCGCNMKLAARYSTVSDYVGTLLREIELVADCLPGRFSVSHLHWGGGTPTTLLPDDLARVMDAVRARFDIVDGAELAIESDPRTLTGEMIGRIGEIGFNRASFGIQEFDPAVQATINRVQPPDMVRAAVEGLRGAGVSAINFDLIYGLPRQTVETLSDTIDTCADMGPDRLALFGYAHVPWVAKRQRMIRTEDLPGPAERLRQASAAAEGIVRQGYHQIGMDHFALPEDALAHAAAKGDLRRNFQGYTTDKAETLIGLGATSIGRLPQGYVQNSADTGAWARAIGQGQLAIGKGYELTAEDRLRGAVIEALMCYGTADLDEIARQHDAAAGWAETACREARAIVPPGLALFEGCRVSLAEGAEPLVRLVASAFDSHLQPSEGRHSVAV